MKSNFSRRSVTFRLTPGVSWRPRSENNTWPAGFGNKRTLTAALSQEILVKTAICIFLIGVTGAIGACGRSADDAPAVTSPAIVSLDDSLQEIASETALTIIDLSVPFERFSEAPERLRRIADALASGSPGLYVLRYHDDTLRHTQHIFAIRQESSTYIKLTSIPYEQQTRIESEISSAEFNEPTKTLILHTQAGDIRLAPADITPVGA